MKGLRINSWVLSGALLIVLAVSGGCRRDMFYQPKGDPLKPSQVFQNDMVSRPLVSNTVAQGQLRGGSVTFSGMVGTNLVTAFPYPINSSVMQRGRQRFEIYCSPCHGRTGGGDGMVVQRGFPPPPSYHIERLRQAPVGHFYRVISHGFGVMYSYSQRVQPDDRWAIAAYIRALQLSEHASTNDVAPSRLAELERNAK